MPLRVCNQPRVRGTRGDGAAKEKFAIGVARHFHVSPSKHPMLRPPRTSGHTFHFPLDWTWQTHLFDTATQTKGGAMLGTGKFRDR